MDKAKPSGVMHYTYSDHLGSIIALTNATGAMEQEQSFDPWGRKRNPNNWSYDNIPAFTLLDRGYIGHEHLNEFGLINMNGRLYDPIVGRILSPDPILQDPTNTQNFNRYSYCFNNPLKYTDPSGNQMALPSEYRNLGVSFTGYTRFSGIPDEPSFGGWGGRNATGDGSGGGGGVLPDWSGIDITYNHNTKKWNVPGESSSSSVSRNGWTWVKGTKGSGWVKNSDIKSYQVVTAWTGTNSLITLKDYYLKEIESGGNGNNPTDGGGLIDATYDDLIEGTGIFLINMGNKYYSALRTKTGKIVIIPTERAYNLFSKSANYVSLRSASKFSIIGGKMISLTGQVANIFNIVLDFDKRMKNEISLGEFGFNTGISAYSAVVGASIGGLPGAAASVSVSTTGEILKNVWNTIYVPMGEYFDNVERTINSGQYWYGY